MFVSFDRGVRVHLGVVALGAPARLSTCLEALVHHESRHDFVVSCLVNPVAAVDTTVEPVVPDGVHVERPGANLGWAGGLHRLRALSSGELFVWVQDDMTPLPGWLDALVDAADTHPAVGCFGALRVDEEDRVLLHNGGWAEPPDQVGAWNTTDRSDAERPTGVTALDWVTSKGCLTRATAFDEVGGPDPRLWPLHHVDKDYSTHLRAHGWDVALVPQARLLHVGSQAAPSAFRSFLIGWRNDWFDARWGPVVSGLRGRTSGEVDHPCAEWRSLEVDPVEAAAAREASRLAVPFARLQAARTRDLTERAQQQAERAQQQAERVERLTATVVDLEQRLAASRRRSHRLRRRLRALQAQEARRGRWRFLRSWRP